MQSTTLAWFARAGLCLAFVYSGIAKLLEPTGRSWGRDVVWSHPAFAHKCVFARNDKELVCASCQQAGHPFMLCPSATKEQKARAARLVYGAPWHRDAAGTTDDKKPGKG